MKTLTPVQSVILAQALREKFDNPETTRQVSMHIAEIATQLHLHNAGELRNAFIHNYNMEEFRHELFQEPEEDGPIFYHRKK